MSKRIIKEYPANMAGERVGWAAVSERSVDDDGGKWLQVDGAYATVGEDGAAVTFRETDDGKIAYVNSELVHGLSHACTWNFLVRRQQDGSLDRTALHQQSTIKISGHTSNEYVYGGWEKMFAGIAGHESVRLEEEGAAQWGVGNQEILEAIKGRLDEYEIDAVYPAMYIAINGVAGRNVYRREGGASSAQIAAYQLADVSQAEVTAREIELASTFDSSMGRQIRQSEEFLQAREKYASSIETTKQDLAHLKRQAQMPYAMIHQREVPSRGLGGMVKDDMLELQSWRQSTSGPWIAALRALHETELSQHRGE